MSAELLSEQDASHETPRASASWTRPARGNSHKNVTSDCSDYDFGESVSVVSASENSGLKTLELHTPVGSMKPSADREGTQNRNKENFPMLQHNYNKKREPSPQRLALHRLSGVTHSRIALARTQSAPMFEARHNYATEDISFLGPREEDTFVILPDEITVEPVLSLQKQLDVAMQALAGMQLEVQELRAELNRRSVTDIDDELFREKNCKVHDLVSSTGHLCSAAEPIVSTSAVSDADLNSEEDVAHRLTSSDFPRLGGLLRTASPLPSPDEPGAASAFLRGHLNSANLPSNKTSSSLATPWQPIDDASPNLGRRQSEPLISSPQASRSPSKTLSIVTTSNYDHLTFFPGTSNTPNPVTPLEAFHDHTRIWTQTPSTASFPESATTHETDSVQEVTESINYRRIMDRNAEMNWHLIVEKIVHYNDQQASVALQQKLKVAPTDQKVAIVDAIIEQAYPLMVNRFGNFLIQRCFEHGTREQIDEIAAAIRGNVLTLSKDAFGCHVVQKALDNVKDECKTAFVQELLTDISATVTHRYACHVWQKLFEVRWLHDAPEIMLHVNAELQGKWTEVAMGETGSLVVQNIFENCLEAERLPCTQEVLDNIPTIVRGQWGNWVVQHIVEHGAEEDRERALDVVMTNAVDYSVDQYASKVIEKAIKSGDSDILARYLSALVNIPESDRARPRVPLIDIASDQYGNYLIQYILTNGTLEQRTLVSAHIRKHMVSMRGSRYGAKVAFTVERMRGGTHLEDRTSREFRSTGSSRGRASMYKNNYRSSRE